MARIKQMTPPIPPRPFMVNDIVRLKAGWTPMTIARISDIGVVTAYYGIQTFDPEGEYNPNCPTSHYSRPSSGFVWWDGDFIPERNLPVARRFTVNNRSSLEIGHLTGFTSTGLHILEFPNNVVEVFTQDEIREIKPFCFAARTTNGTLSYTFDNPDTRVEVKDILIDHTGMYCVVTEINTNPTKPKIFSGRKVLTQEL